MKRRLAHVQGEPQQRTSETAPSTRTEQGTGRHTNIDWQRVFKDVGDRLREKYGEKWRAEEQERRDRCELVELPDWDDGTGDASTRTAGASRVLL